MNLVTTIMLENEENGFWNGEKQSFEITVSDKDFPFVPTEAMISDNGITWTCYLYEVKYYKKTNKTVCQYKKY